MKTGLAISTASLICVRSSGFVGTAGIRSSPLLSSLAGKSNPLKVAFNPDEEQSNTFVPPILPPSKGSSSTLKAHEVDDDYYFAQWEKDQRSSSSPRSGGGPPFDPAREGPLSNRREVNRAYHRDSSRNSNDRRRSRRRDSNREGDHNWMSSLYVSDDYSRDFARNDRLRSGPRKDPASYGYKGRSDPLRGEGEYYLDREERNFGPRSQSPYTPPHQINRSRGGDDRDRSSRDGGRRRQEHGPFADRREDSYGPRREGNYGSREGPYRQDDYERRDRFGPDFSGPGTRPLMSTNEHYSRSEWRNSPGFTADGRDHDYYSRNEEYRRRDGHYTSRRNINDEYSRSNLRGRPDSSRFTSSENDRKSEYPSYLNGDELSRDDFLTGRSPDNYERPDFRGRSDLSRYATSRNDEHDEDYPTSNGFKNDLLRGRRGNASGYSDSRPPMDSSRYSTSRNDPHEYSRFNREWDVDPYVAPRYTGMRREEGGDFRDVNDPRFTSPRFTSSANDERVPYPSYSIDGQDFLSWSPSLSGRIDSRYNGSYNDVGSGVRLPSQVHDRSRAGSRGMLSSYGNSRYSSSRNDEIGTSTSHINGDDSGDLSWMTSAR